MSEIKINDGLSDSEREMFLIYEKICLKYSNKIFNDKNIESQKIIIDLLSSMTNFNFKNFDGDYCNGDDFDIANIIGGYRIQPIGGQSDDDKLEMVLKYTDIILSNKFENFNLLELEDKRNLWIETYKILHVEFMKSLSGDSYEHPLRDASIILGFRPLIIGISKLINDKTEKKN